VRALSTVPALEAALPDDTAVLFAPDDDVHAACKLVLAAATSSLRIAQFTFTDPGLIALVREASTRPLPFLFQMTLDESETKSVKVMGEFAASFANDPRVAVGNSARGAFSHLKVAVIDDTYVLSGSTNFTLSGDQKEDNELMLRQHSGLARLYGSHLDEIYHRMRGS
jgi:phosphatidylserine/phosphatidylglycerophosphate/cardiolipin synthase-like enzyme